MVRNALARPALRRANVAETTRLQPDCCPDAQPWHRRECGDLHAAACNADEKPACGRPQDAGADWRQKWLLYKPGNVRQWRLLTVPDCGVAPAERKRSGVRGTGRHTGRI